MTNNGRTLLRWPVIVGGAALFAAIGSAGTYLALDRGPDERLTRPVAALPIGDAAPPAAAVSLSAETAKRAGLTVVVVESTPVGDVLRLPATVEPNAYKRVAVTPLVSGRVTQVMADLGAEVKQGQTLTTIFSPELAEAQTRFVSSSAELEAHELELARTEKLVQIGAASRQDLERIHAEHTAQRTTVQSARSRLELLGVSHDAVVALERGGPVDAQTDVVARASGVVTERFANAGLNVDASTTLFTVVDLSSVWVVASLYEQDFARVRTGNRATITFPAYPDLRVDGVVSYIDPQVSPETRTAKVRVEVANPRRELRLGMLAQAEIENSARAAAPTIPTAAVQTVGARSVVYVPDGGSTTRFLEREVRLGTAFGERVEVLSGLRTGEQVVGQGSFFLRAERERLGLTAVAAEPGAADGSQQRATARQAVKIVVNEKGFEPADVKLKAGVAARLTFTRTTDKTCATEVVFPSMKIKRALPLNQPVDIDFTPAKNVGASFACGMNMFKGSVVVVD